MHIRGVVGNSSTACATHGPFGVWLQPPQLVVGAPARQQLALKRNGKMAVWPLMQAAYFAMPVRPKKCRGPKTQKDARNYCCCERNGQSCGPQLWLGQKCTDPPFCNLELFLLRNSCVQGGAKCHTRQIVRRRLAGTLPACAPAWPWAWGPWMQGFFCDELFLNYIKLCSHLNLLLLLVK